MRTPLSPASPVSLATLALVAALALAGAGCGNDADERSSPGTSAAAIKATSFCPLDQPESRGCVGSR